MRLFISTLCSVVALYASPAAGQEVQQIASIASDSTAMAAMQQFRDPQFERQKEDEARKAAEERVAAYCTSEVPKVIAALIAAHPADADDLRSPESTQRSFSLCVAGPSNYISIMYELQPAPVKKK